MSLNQHDLDGGRQGKEPYAKLLADSTSEEATINGQAPHESGVVQEALRR